MFLAPRISQYHIHHVTFSLKAKLMMRMKRRTQNESSSELLDEASWTNALFQRTLILQSVTEHRIGL